MSLRVVPLTLKQANELIACLHRHHKPVVGHRFSLGALHGEKLIGGCVVGRPVARGCDPWTVAEVTRLVTDGTANACSLLYGAAARACKAMGFERIQTYTLESECGASLRASGWEPVARTAGGKWTHTSGPRRDDQPTEPKIRWERTLNPAAVARQDCAPNANPTPSVAHNSQRARRELTPEEIKVLFS